MGFFPPRAAIGFAVVLSAGLALADAPRVGRLALDEPEILLNAGGRTGVCDVLTFTPAGDVLFAAGEDKVVHSWAVDAKGLHAQKPLYWNTFRERRGSIYAAALHPDPKRPLLAVAGFGKLDPDVVVFDLSTGTIAHALSPALIAGYALAKSTVWSLAFHPSGRELAVGDDRGNVWVWQLAGGVTRVVEGVPKLDYAARVAWVGYLPDGRLGFARRDGRVCAVNPGGGVDVLFNWAAGPPAVVAASRDGRWLAALPKGEAADGSRVEVRSLPDGATARTVSFPPGRFPDRAALSGDGAMLAVGVAEFGPERHLLASDPPGAVAVYDLRADRPRLVAEATGLDLRPDQLALHPDGTRLATAGGDAHATVLWKIAGGGLTRLAEVVGRGQPLWAVRMTADGRYLAFRTGRGTNPGHPNDRGTGDWTTFDLTRRDWAAATPKGLVPPTDALGGWTVAPDPKDEFAWSAVAPNGERQSLDLNRLQDDRPQCYTFLPAGPDAPAGAVRLAVGHYWGISLFELVPGKLPRLDRKLTGHVGAVTSVAPALGGKALVSCGRDNVVAFWSLADFPSQPVLGAAFAADPNGRVVVAAVDSGGPAEEAGLSVGDVLKSVAYDGANWLPPAARLDRLQNPTPMKELAFRFERDKVPGELAAKTSVLHRPVARFFPARDGEWVLYTYRQCYYDGSTNGDRYIRWLVSKDLANIPPEPFPVDRFRMLHRPDKVADAIGRLVREPCKPVLADLFPPDVTAEVVPDPADPAAVEVVAVVRPRPRQDGKVNPVDRVEVWVNGHYRAGSEPTAGRSPEAGKSLRVTFKLSAANLRAGSNEVRAVAVGRDAGVGVSPPVRVAGPATGKARRLFGVSVGINQYRYESGPLHDLTCAVSDARRFRDAWAGHYAGRPSLLTDEAVTRGALLKAVADASAADPDDLFVLFLAGHGALGEHVGGTDEWYYLIPRAGAGPLAPSDWANKTTALRAAFLRDDHLFDALAGLRCQTVVVLDCCHAGASAQARESVAVTTRARALRPYGYGPIVIAACAPAQSSYELNGRGFFTGRVVRALGDGFADADANKDRRLSAAELYEYVRAGVARDVDGLEDENQQPVRQTPQIAPPVDQLGELILAEPGDRK